MGKPSRRGGRLRAFQLPDLAKSRPNQTTSKCYITQSTSVTLLVLEARPPKMAVVDRKSDNERKVVDWRHLHFTPPWWISLIPRQPVLVVLCSTKNWRFSFYFQFVTECERNNYITQSCTMYICAKYVFLLLSLDSTKTSLSGTCLIHKKKRKTFF